MSNDQGLLAAIRANPTDDALKLIYADWLEERGDPRAEFLRLSVSLRSLPPEDGKYPTLLARWEELYKTISPTFVALVDRPSAENDVREAVFRYQFAGHHSPQGLFFISIEDGRDPSPPLLGRFKSHRPAVKAVSASNNDKRRRDRVVDRQTGKQGTLFWVSKITWANERHCTVRGGYYFGPLASAVREYGVALKEDKWQVISKKTLLIS